MSYPQTTPVQATFQGLDAWRLFTAIEGSGDIYESNTSGVSFAIGSESDIARAAITYFDPTQADKVTTQEVSVGRPAINRIDSKVTTRFATGQQARVLISLRDVLPPANYRPPQASASGSIDSDIVNTFMPQLDLFQYLTPPSNVIAGRSDRIYRIQVPALISPGAPVQKAFYLFPFYGRRSFYLTAINNDTTSAVSFAFFGANFSFLLNSPATATQIAASHQTIQIGSTVVVAAAGGLGEFAWPVTSPKYFDYVYLEVTPADAIPAQVFTFTMTVRD